MSFRFFPIRDGMSKLKTKNIKSLASMKSWQYFNYKKLKLDTEWHKIGYMNIQIKLFDPKAKLPTRGSDFSAGYDLYTIEQYELKPGERHLFATGVTMAM